MDSSKAEFKNSYIFNTILFRHWSYRFFQTVKFTYCIFNFVIPFVFQFIKFRKINYQICVRGILAIILFFLPIFLLSSLNQNLTGVSSDELYAQQDFNAQHELWGEYFTESTQGGMLVTSFIASVGYASLIQSLVHAFRDLLLQFENYLSSYIIMKSIPRILGCCILSIPFTLIIFRHFGELGNIFPKRS